jgi:tetratricopeptide (TPR) repeat protein
MAASAGQALFSYDVFISHASEDKAAFVDDLVKVLHERGLRVWYDSFEIKLGDDFRRKMEQGLLGSRFGVVVLSPSFLQANKYWTQQELSALFTFEADEGGKRILPVLYGVSRQTLARTFPFLATRRTADASVGVDAVADQIVAVTRDTPVTPSRPASRLFAVPLPSQSFVGRRRELDQLKRDLAAADVRVCAAVEGLPGIGKTELVLKLAYELAAAGEFPGGIFWLPAESPDLTAAWSSDEIAGALGQAGETARERALNAVNMLSRRDARVLVILDNVEAWDKHSQPAPLPSGANVTLLVTTRKSHLGGNRFNAFKLEFLGPAEARALLTGLAGAEVATRPGFDALLDFLDGHALAVELAGIYLREYPEVTPAAYLAGLQAGRDLSAKVAKETQYEASVNQSFGLLWQRLDEATRNAWQRASWFAPEPVSPALADACGLDSEARRALHRFHLVDLDNEGRLRIHRLTRTFGQSAGDEEARTVARRAFLDGVTARAKLIDVAVGFRVYLPDRAHFEEALRLAAEEPGDVASRSMLLDGIGTACHSMGDLTRAHDLLEQSLASDIKNLGEDHPDVATSRNNLAVVLQDQGDLVRAQELLDLALASGIKNLGVDHPEVAIRRSNLASVLIDQGDLTRARDLLELALDSDIKNLGEDHPSVATWRSNLAIVLKNQGDLARARDLLELALASDIKNLGDDHPEVAIRRYNLAGICEQEGDLVASLGLLERALRSELVSLGVDHPSAAMTRAKISNLLSRVGKHDEARKEAQEALRIVASQPKGSYFRTKVENLTAGLL